MKQFHWFLSVQRTRTAKRNVFVKYCTCTQFKTNIYILVCNEPTTCSGGVVTGFIA